MAVKGVAAEGPRFLIGIDLGTTQCALSYLDLKAKKREIKSFSILQFVDKGQTSGCPTLPSLLFLPDDSAVFGTPPWSGAPGPIAGSFARQLGAELPARLIHSAKSWLCHPRIDRLSSILPWQSELVRDKLSPVDASAAYLRHLADVWNHAMAADDPDLRLENQQIIVTVPASFDPVARNLTLEAITRSGLSVKTLLEEPQAAFYDFLARHPKTLERELRDVKTALVIDIGGGTTDFSLIGVEWPDTSDEPQFTRLAVGPHLLIGGDNLDLAVAKAVEAKFHHKGRKLVAKQWLSVLDQSRSVKERALGDAGDEAEKARFTVSGAGSRVVAQSFSLEIPLPELREMLVDGYFPVVAADERPAEDAGIGLSEAGLPYSRDPAVTRHLAAFLAEHGAIPDAVLFNGGTMLSNTLRARIMDVLAAWRGGEPPRELNNPHPMLAVASGAVYYSMVGLGLGHRIKAGSPVSIYLGIGTGKSGRGEKHVPEQVLCLLPKGSEVERPLTIAGKTFGVDVGQDVAFYAYFSPSAPRGESLGDLMKYSARRLTPLPPLRWKTEKADSRETGIRQVGLDVTLRETGRLQVVCHGCGGDTFRRELMFDLTPEEETETDAAVAKGLTKRQIGQIRKVIDGLFSNAPDKPAFNQLFKLLEELLGTRRENWNTAVLRTLFDLSVDDERFQSGDDARMAWLRLVGYALRPGFGAPGDVGRVDRLFELRKSPPVSKNTGLWSEWWIMWKRIAPGLSAERQAEVAGALEAVLFPPKRAGKGERIPDQHERNQVWRLLAQCERIPIEEKIRIGTWILRAPGTWGRDQIALYTLGRLGARVMSYAPPTMLVPVTTVSEWAEQLLKRGPAPAGSSYADWALREFGRKTGDRLVQVDDALRKRIFERLKTGDRKKSFLQPLLEVQVLQADDLAEFCGERLPSGFVWVSESGEEAEDISEA